jgi:hypothetical protein
MGSQSLTASALAQCEEKQKLAKMRKANKIKYNKEYLFLDFMFVIRCGNSR